LKWLGRYLYFAEAVFMKIWKWLNIFNITWKRSSRFSHIYVISSTCNWHYIGICFYKQKVLSIICCMTASPNHILPIILCSYFMYICIYVWKLHYRLVLNAMIGITGLPSYTTVDHTLHCPSKWWTMPKKLICNVFLFQSLISHELHNIHIYFKFQDLYSS
jgi:hypothetical protein